MRWILLFSLAVCAACNRQSAEEQFNLGVKYQNGDGVKADPAKAAEGTIRKAFAKSISENSVHGSDGPETAQKEIAQFFSGKDIVG